MPEDRPRRPPGPGDYLFFVVPEPILRTQRITRADKLIWAVIYAWQRMGRRRLTVAKVAELVGQDRRYVRKRLDHLEREGLIGRRRKRRRGVHLVDLWVDWPDWIVAEGVGMLIHPVEVAEDEEEMSSTLESDASPEDAGKDHTERKNPSACYTQGGELNTPPGGELSTPPGGELSTPPVKRSLKRGSGVSVASIPDGCEPDAPGEPPAEELEENPDGGSRTVTTRLERRVQEKRAAREAAGGRVKRERRPPSGSDLAETPSARWEWTSWKTKARNRWVATDLVGYWVGRFREVRGVEDPEFFVTSVGAPAVVRLTKNVRRYVETWLNGDFYGEGRDAVDLILERAADRGLPVSLAYYFTPSKRGALPGLGKTATRGRGAPTPTERSDASGGDRSFWRDRARAQEER